MPVSGLLSSYLKYISTQLRLVTATFLLSPDSSEAWLSARLLELQFCGTACHFKLSL